jgi:hypothetical protein
VVAHFLNVMKLVFAIVAEGKNIFLYKNMRTEGNILHYFYNAVGLYK